MAYAEGGRFDLAQTTAQQAIALASAADRSDVLALMQVRLRLYQTGSPYHEPAANAPPGTRD